MGRKLMHLGAVFLALMVLVSCGGSSSKGQESFSNSTNVTVNNPSLEENDSSTSAPPKTADSNSSQSTTTHSFTTIEGAVLKGAIANAVITLYRIDTNESLGETKSNSLGEYNITIDTNYTGVVQVIAKGGSYIDEIDGKSKDASSLTLSAVGFLDGNITLYITPLTTIARKQMRYNKGSLVNLSKDEIEAFHTQIAQIFTDSSFDSSKVAPKIVQKEQLISESDGVSGEYGVTLALIASLSLGDASTVNSIIDELFEDIKDDKKLDKLYLSILKALNNPILQERVSSEVLSKIKTLLEKYVTKFESIRFSKTLYQFDDFEGNSSNALYRDATPLVEIDRSKKYHIFTKVKIGQSQTDTQPMQYFGFEELDENQTHIDGPNGTYTYLIEAKRLESGEYEFSFIIKDANLSAKTKYIRPIILANYQADTNAVATSWSNIKIEELNYNDINSSLADATLPNEQTLQGAYGTLTLEKNGSYSYVLDYSALLKSQKGESFLDSFDINSSSTIKKLTITIHNLGYNPKIVLNGLKDVYLEQGFEYHPMGATASDIEDGDISAAITIDTSELDNSKVGAYKIYYRVRDLDNLEAKPTFRVIHILSSQKEYGRVLDENDTLPVYAQYMITTTSASMLSLYRRNLSLEINPTIEHLASYAYGFVRGAIYWSASEDGDFIWERGIRKEDDEYKYAGKVNGEYQKIPTDSKCADPYSTDPECNLQVAIVDGIGMDSSHYLAKWPIFFKELRDSSLNLTEAAYYDEILKNNALRLEKNVSEFVDGVYKLTNYMDGTNGVYRWNYLNRGKNYGYNSYELSNIQVYSSGLAFLDSSLVENIFNHILNNIPSYEYILEQSIQELLLRLSLEYNNPSATLSCVDINSYEQCKEKYLFEHLIKPELLISFTGDDANELASYYKVVGAHYLIMQYAFEHNISEWKKIYYQHFKNFIQEVIDTNAKHFQNLDSNSSLTWKNSNSYAELHYMLWASSFLKLSSTYDKRDYSQYNFTIEDEIKLRDFLEHYLWSYYKNNNQWGDFDKRYYKIK